MTETTTDQLESGAASATETPRELSPDQITRLEFKYVIPPEVVPELRAFVRLFCVPDKHARNDPPSYTVTTLQMDSPSLSLYHATHLDTLNRFKLRARVYRDDPKGRVHLEIKRKLHYRIVKSRAAIPRELWGRETALNPTRKIAFGSEQEEHAYLEFVRLMQHVGAEPVTLIRYEREAYMSTQDRYARVTIDRRLCYRPTRRWNDWGDDEQARWYSLDTENALDRPFAGAVLELKTGSDVPVWMIDLVQRLGLVRSSYCKYGEALLAEARFRPRLHPIELI
jgi:hypothetical protein